MENKEQARICREQDFYARCAEILNIDHEYKTQFKYKTRWNARVIGNGRYPGFGVITPFGPFIRVMCRKGTFTFETYEEVYAFLLTSNSAIIQE